MLSVQFNKVKPFERDSNIQKTQTLTDRTHNHKAHIQGQTQGQGQILKATFQQAQIQTRPTDRQRPRAHEAENSNLV